MPGEISGVASVGRRHGTGVFFFLGGDLYSTIVLHNAFAIRGVIHDALLIRPHVRGVVSGSSAIRIS